ncbi:MAG: ferritin family protein [Candidatus Omnitrophica bacterium]|jgi:rubrerythrin|nr:ferritin family protein [Candidatus Omnitrophota bacterium]
MSKDFSPQEILKIAIRVEENGKNLYQSLEDKAKKDELKALWRYLKEQEKIHRQTFQEMLDNIKDYVIYEFNPGEYQAYLRAIASEYIFTQELVERKIKEGFGSDSEALKFGIFIEKESILTYTALKEYITTDKQSVLDKIIDEEKWHLVKLSVLKDSFK